MTNITRITLTAAAIAVATGSASAVVLPFSEPDFDWLSQQGAGVQYYIWTTGDFWAQDFPATGVTSATDLTLDLNLNPTAGSPIQNLSFDVFLNGTNVGSFTVTPADNGSFFQTSFNFPAVAGPNYDLDIIATSTISSGAGSYSLLVDPSTSQGSFVTITPTPGAATLLGLGGIAALRRRRRA